MSDRVTVAQLKQAILNLQPLMGAGKSKKKLVQRYLSLRFGLSRNPQKRLQRLAVIGKGGNNL